VTINQVKGKVAQKKSGFSGEEEAGKELN